MENRKTFHIELTTIELEAIISALKSDANLRDDESFTSLIDELVEIRNG
jgi:hypothetical protein